MKKAILLFIPIFLVFVIGCFTTKPNVEESGYVEERGLDMTNVIPDGAVPNEIDHYRNLVDFLYRVPGVQVTGPSSNPTITVRGISSINSGIEPLYVIDGVPVGTNYSSVNNMLNIRDVSYVQVLKGSETALYGIRGTNGIILISTRR